MIFLSVLKQFVKLALMVFIVSGCRNKDQQLAGSVGEIASSQKIRNLQVSEIKGKWKLERSYQGKIEIDNGDDVFDYNLPDEVEAETVLLFKNGDGSIEDWGLDLPSLLGHNTSNLSTSKRGIAAAGITTNLLFLMTDNGFIMEVSMIIDYTKYSPVWKHVASYRKLKD